MGDVVVFIGFPMLFFAFGTFIYLVATVSILTEIHDELKKLNQTKEVE